MSKGEKIPLLSMSSQNSETATGGYLLLSVPQTEDKSVTRLNKLGNYAGVIVAISATVIVFVLIFGVSYHADVSELTSGNNQVKKATGPDSIDASSQNERIHKEIETPLGRLRGYVHQSRKGRDYFAFHQVPYAKPPIDQLRFKDPQPVEKWEGVRDFDEGSPSCTQKSKHAEDNEITGKEDCLYSDIYVPRSAQDNAQHFPVMVYIHGGGFADGNGSRYGAEYIMDEDVVLVTFQYRLGLFGFLNTGDREATGNMGFKDQVMFLKWTKENIRSFNGDPEKVTIFGNSMGGFSIGFLTLSPMANGLFHRAISQSGTTLCEYTSNLDLEPEVTKKAVAEAFNCSLDSSIDLLACLRNVDAKDLALLKTSDIRYALTVEQGFDPNDLSDVFMPDKPYNLLKSGKVNPVPYMMGVVSTEWIGASLVFLKSDALIDNLNANFSLYAPIILGMDLTPEESQSIKSFYFQDKLISNETERNLTNLLSDRIMVHGTKVTADLYSASSETFLYYLSKRPSKSYADKFLLDFPNVDKTNAVSHADEVQFLFPYLGYPEYPISDTEYFPFSEFMVKLWANFAATGKPSIEGKVSDWNAVSNQGPSSWYELNDNSGLTSVLAERMDFWDQFSHKKMMYEL